MGVPVGVPIRYSFERYRRRRFGRLQGSLVLMTRLTWWSAVARSTKVTTTPVLQVAGDGRWEGARAVVVSGSSTRAAMVVQEVASTADRDVAVEVLWPGQAFVGVRGPVEQLDDAAAAASRASVIVRSAHGIEGALLGLLSTVPNPDLEFAELGAVNAWASVGPEVLWRRGNAHSPQALDARLAGRPDLTICANPVAVELAVVHPRACWIGIVVSTKSGPAHYVDRQALDQVLALSI